MINFKTYESKEPFDVYKEAVDRKREEDEKLELHAIEEIVKSCYDDYNIHHNKNTLETHLPTLEVSAQKQLLLSLYGSKNKVIKDFRAEYFRINPGSYNNLCPYCVISESNTTEHILPKDIFPEYAINVLNLIPACSQCNSFKGESYLDKNGDRFTINFYTDSLPDIQFLVAEIFQNATELRVEYRLNNPGNRIRRDLFDLICRHYKRYNLIERYNIQAMAHLPEIINEFRSESFINEEEFDKYSTKYLRKCFLDQTSYGHNHWRVVLRLGAVASLDFKGYIMSLSFR